MLLNEEWEWWIVIFVLIYIFLSVNVLKIIRVKNEFLLLWIVICIVGVFDCICCGFGNDKFYYWLKYIKNLVFVFLWVGGFFFYVWNLESLDFDYNLRCGVI